MAYPTVAFKLTSHQIGAQPIEETSATQRHPLGEVVYAKDVTYGEGAFIYLVGVASTDPGDLCFYNSSTGATVRGIHAGTGSQGPACVAMSANLAGGYGWYQIEGAGPVKAATVAANTAPYLTATAGQLDDLVVVGDLLDGCAFKAATAASFATIQLNRPSLSSESVQAGLVTAQANIATNTTNIATNTASIVLLVAHTYCTLSAAVEGGDAIVVTGQIKTLDGVNVAVAKQVMVRSFAVTANNGDITVTAGTEKKTLNPATGENISWIESTAAGVFAVSIANAAVEETLVEATPADGLTAMLKLSFSA